MTSSRGAAFRAELMGVAPADLGRVAWFRAGLLPHPLSRYLGHLGRRLDALLLSESLREE
jgi:hypothetical protein